MIYIIMGVSASGKTLIGSKLSERLELPFYDADNFHPDENVQKMQSGTPLNDRDRLPWLQLLARSMVDWEQNGGAVLACSALKKSYRSLLSPPGIPVVFIHLQGSKKVIGDRMAERTGHYMPEELLDSQFDALEPPHDAITVSVDKTPEQIIEEILGRLST